MTPQPWTTVPGGTTSGRERAASTGCRSPGASSSSSGPSLANTTSDGSFFAASGLRLALYNTARGRVSDKSAGYTGAPTGIDLGTAPAAYANRFEGDSDAESAMRFQGWYYVQVSLDPKVPGSVPLTLDVGIEGAAQQGPPYDGDAAAAGFGLGDAGGTAGGTSGSMRALGFTGIGVGTVLVLGLGTWYLLSRRRRPPRDRRTRGLSTAGDRPFRP